ncbi:feruloyl CoA ortho-hydroxylase F6H1-3-like [Telopea speciosissima]|uniref:feruloyl CoA ortho-hydroxylase F6H1-3-like n=1 Tax=Telopea speciosissima TaxID=54955 RepID=UPI001CC6710C|nr:feruloyl CoA ortho-hydroxylase F6H1-3-like [Telopea speciosissima]
MSFSSQHPIMATVISNSSELMEFIVKKGNGIKGLAETGLTSVPKQYIQPMEERIDIHNVKIENSIPVIDMANWDDPKLDDLICDAAEKCGFFQVINHRVPLDVLKSVKDATHKFFGLPADEKLKYTKEMSPSKNVRYGTSFIPRAEVALEWKDYLSLFYVSDDEVSAYWPKECKEQAMEFMEKSEPLVKKLLKVLMKRLNVKDIDEGKELLLMGSKMINLNYYPICPNPELTVGVGRHSDVSTLTILLQDDVGGLYVRGNSGDSWINVPPASNGSLVINVGDALQILSNGRYKSAEHYVIANRSRNRVSIPFFVNPRPKDMIGPLPEVLEINGEKPLYKQVLYSDYTRHFYRKAHDGKKTIDFAVI